MTTHSGIESNFVEIEDLRIHYLSAGNGEAVLLVHGWPTSSYLWRNIMLPLSKTRKVIALDLPGFGQSSKPLDASYSFNYFDRIIDSFLKKVGISQTSMVVHDLGGPAGLIWAVRHPEKISSLVLLNTLVYPEFSWAVKLFVLATFAPGIKKWMASPSGIAAALRLGVYHKKKLTEEVLINYKSPFQTKKTQKALLKTVQGLSPRGYKEIAEKLPNFKVPVRLIYGENDKALPDIANTMRRVQEDLTQAQLTKIPNCGHFLQEDEPDRLSQLLVEFFDAH